MATSLSCLIRRCWRNSCSFNWLLVGCCLSHISHLLCTFSCFYMLCRGSGIRQVGPPDLWFPCSLNAHPTLTWRVWSCLPASTTCAVRCYLCTGLSSWRHFLLRCGAGEGWGASPAGLRVASYFPSRKQSPVGVRKQFFSHCCMSNRASYCFVYLVI